MEASRATRWADGLVLALVVALAAALRLLLVLSIEPTLHDVIPIIESHNYAGSHDLVSLAWRHLTGWFWADPPAGWFRVPSCAASLALVGLLTLRVRADSGRLVGGVVGLLAATSFPLVLLASQVRGYSMHILGTWLLLSGLRGMMQGGRGSRVFVLGAILAAAHQFVTVVAATGMAVLCAWAVLAWRTPPVRNLRAPASLRSLAAALLVVGAAGAMWFGNLALTGVNAAYQQGSPHLMGVGRIDQRGLAGVLLWPFGWLHGGPSWAILPWYALALAGLAIALWRRTPGTRLLLAGALLYALLPLLLNLSVGSVGMQPGQAAFLAVPLVTWVAVGIAGVAEGLPALIAKPSTWRLVASRLIAAALVVLLAVPAAEAVLRYARRGFSTETGYRFGEMADRLDGLLAQDNLVFVESQQFFHSAHLLAWRFGDRADRLRFVSERLPQPTLFRRFLLHDWSHAPGTYFDAWRWEDFDGWIARRERFTGRVFLFLPDNETLSMEEWLDATPGGLRHRCNGTPRFPGGLRVWEGRTGWIAWADLRDATPGETVAVLREGWNAYMAACPNVFFLPDGPQPQGGIPGPPGGLQGGPSIPGPR